MQNKTCVVDSSRPRACSQRDPVETSTWPIAQDACDYDDHIEVQIVAQKTSKLRAKLHQWVLVTRVWAIATNDTTPFRLVILEGNDNAKEFSVRALRPCVAQGWHIHEVHFEDEKIVVSEDQLLCAVDVRHVGGSTAQRRVRVQVCEEHCMEILCAILGRRRANVEGHSVDMNKFVHAWKASTILHVQPYTQHKEDDWHDYYEPLQEEEEGKRKAQQRWFACTKPRSTIGEDAQNPLDHDRHPEKRGQDMEADHDTEAEDMVTYTRNTCCE